MKETYQQTSLLAYESILKLGNKQKQVYDVIKHLGKATNRMIAKELGLEINQVTGRTNELVKSGLVADAKKDICPIGGKLSIFWWCV